LPKRKTEERKGHTLVSVTGPYLVPKRWGGFRKWRKTMERKG